MVNMLDVSGDVKEKESIVKKGINMIRDWVGCLPLPHRDLRDVGSGKVSEDWGWGDRMIWKEKDE